MNARPYFVNVARDSFLKAITSVLVSIRTYIASYFNKIPYKWFYPRDIYEILLFHSTTAQKIINFLRKKQNEFFLLKLKT